MKHRQGEKVKVTVTRSRDVVAEKRNTSSVSGNISVILEIEVAGVNGEVRC